MDKDTSLPSFGKCVSPINQKIIPNWTAEDGEDEYVKKLYTFAYLLIFMKMLRSINIRVCGTLSPKSKVMLPFKKSLELPPSVVRHSFLEKIICCHPKWYRWCLSISLRNCQQILPPSPRIGTVKLLDSTTMGLCLSKYKLTTYRKTKVGVKLHLRVCFSELELFILKK